MVRLTERAAEHVLALMREDPEALALQGRRAGRRLLRACQYASASTASPSPATRSSTSTACKVVVDRFSLPYLSGAEVDFVDGLMGQGFTVNNPNAVASCGCGSSFKAEGDEAAASAGGCSTCSACRPAAQPEKGAFMPWCGASGGLDAVEGVLYVAQPAARDQEVEVVVAGQLRSSRAAARSAGRRRMATMIAAPGSSASRTSVPAAIPRSSARSSTSSECSVESVALSISARRGAEMPLDQPERARGPAHRQPLCGDRQHDDEEHGVEDVGRPGHARCDGKRGEDDRNASAQARPGQEPLLAQRHSERGRAQQHRQRPSDEHERDGDEDGPEPLVEHARGRDQQAEQDEEPELREPRRLPAGSLAPRRRAGCGRPR